MGREWMTSRERVLATLRRQPVDRLPLDLGSHMSTGISAFAYRNLRLHLGLAEGEIWIPDVVQMLAYVEEDIRQRFHIDTVLLETPWAKARRWRVRDDYEFTIPEAMTPELDETGAYLVCKPGKAKANAMRMPKGGFFFDGAWHSNWGSEEEDRELDLYAREAERIYKETPYATNFVGYSRFNGFGAFFGGMNRLMEMVEEPEKVKTEHQILCDREIKRAGKVIDRLGRYIQLLSINADMGMQNGPLCRPSVVEECVAPYLKRFCDFIHQYSDVKIFMHNCGSIRPLLPILIDCGVDVLNPVQISARDMNPADLKRQFGDRLVFWGGGCDTQNVLDRASPAEVAGHVRSLVGTFKPGGGFVFNQVHNIMGNVPPQNIVAMLDSAYEESFYPSRPDGVPVPG